MYGCRCEHWMRVNEGEGEAEPQRHTERDTEIDRQINTSTPTHGDTETRQNETCTRADWFTFRSLDPARFTSDRHLA